MAKSQRSKATPTNTLVEGGVQNTLENCRSVLGLLSAAAAVNGITLDHNDGVYRVLALVDDALAHVQGSAVDHD